MRFKSWLQSFARTNHIRPSTSKRRWIQNNIASGVEYQVLEPRRMLANGFIGPIELQFVGDIHTHEHSLLDHSPREPEGPSEAGPEQGPFANDDTFKLHSKPDSNYTIYLDFDGHITEGTTWNQPNQFNLPTIVHPAYDRGGTPGVFTQSELDLIQQAWQRVADDFAAFDVDVTTEDPGTEALRKDSSGTDTQWGVRAVMTADTWASCGCGGFAYLNSFQDKTDEPNFVFNNSLNGVSETISHEVGHQIGLGHDGKSSTTYYSGHGSGVTSWGAIMGAPFSKTITQWDQGEYYDANNQQDDLNVITTSNGFGYRVDDFGDSIGTAGNLSITGGTSISGFGIIEQTGDVDFLRFDHGGGNVSFSLTPHDNRPNLDIWAGIYDSGGNFLHGSDTFESTNVPLAINDLATITSDIVISESATISDVGVTLDISHTMNADLDVFIIHPDGTRVELFSDVGSGSADFTNTTLDDESATDIAAGSAPFTGYFVPAGSLADLDGKSIAGTWQLEITDDTGGDVGTLNSWSLNINRLSASFENVSLAAGTFYIKVEGVGSDGIYNSITDSVEDPTSNVPWTLSSPSGYSDYGSLGQYSISGTIVAPSSDTFSVTPLVAVQREGNSGITDYTFTVSRSGNTSVASDVDYSVISTRQAEAGGNAPYTVDASDFVGGVLPSGQVSFLAGETSKTVTIGVVGDVDVERNEEFALVLDNQTAGWALADSRAEGTIEGDESQVHVMNGMQFRWRQENFSGSTDNFAIDNVSVTNTSFADDFDPGIDVAQWASIVGGVANSTFTGSVGNSLFFDGTSERSATTSVLEVQAGDQLSFDLIFGDSANGGENTDSGENVVLEYTVDDGSTWQTIRTYDQNFYKTFTTFTVTVPSDAVVESVAVLEGSVSDTDFAFEVFRRDNLDKSISVDWSVSGFGANPADATDFAGGVMPSGVLSFAADEVSKTIYISVAGDSLDELDEMFTLDLTSSTGGPLGVTSRIATILNDDVGINQIAPGAANEGDAGTANATFEITLTAPQSTTVTVDYTTTNLGYSNPASPGIDYVETTGTATFLPGETSYFVDVPVNGDLFLEADEQFGLELSNSINGNIVDVVSDSTILNDEVFGNDVIVDFGTPTSPVLGIGVGFGTEDYSAAIGMGWSSYVDLTSAEKTVGNDLARDIAQMRSGTFSVDVPNDIYDVTIYYGVVRRRDPFRITFESDPQITEFLTFGTNVSRVYTTIVSDGQLNMAFSGTPGLDPFARIAGFKINPLAVSKGGDLGGKGLKGDLYVPQMKMASVDSVVDLGTKVDVEVIKGSKLSGSITPALETRLDSFFDDYGMSEESKSDSLVDALDRAVEELLV